MIDFAIEAPEAAKILGISLRELEFWRQFGVGPQKIAIRNDRGWKICYLKSEITALANDQTALAAARAEYHRKRQGH